MSLPTGAHIVKYKWSCLPIITKVIDRVHELANNQISQGEMQDIVDLFLKEKMGQFFLQFRKRNNTMLNL